jgi:hypothetical protein
VCKGCKPALKLAERIIGAAPKQVIVGTLHRVMA